MKTPLLISFFFLLSFARAQITTPAVNAGFGVDADLKARSVTGAVQASDDWYLHPANTGTSGTNVIDTTGAATIVAGYNSDVSPWNKRMASFYRSMSVPSFTVVDNRLWLDALFVRDYHGNDATSFTAGADKNGMSPGSWSGGQQGVPDKNDILDMFMHVRRAGPDAADPLWFFGGLSLANVTGNRYFDFEMYQTDIYFDRPSAKWYGYGPDAGHTTWKFDAAGNVVKPGDIIFSAEYQSSSLTHIEARIWIDKASLNITPAQFKWSGKFDGANSGAQFGYASIIPKTAGDFYTGLQSSDGEWTGPFSLVLQDNSLATNYVGKQFMEFSVNLTKLGLDPVSIFGSDICGTPFNRMVVKTRASASFTAELKDFVAPTDLFLSPRVAALADVPLFCGNLNNISTLQVTNPSSSSVYTWTTADGHLIDNPVSPVVRADSAGTYIVTQQLMAGCSPFAKDTVQVIYDPTCTVMEEKGVEVKISLKNGLPVLNWQSRTNATVAYYTIQRSYNGSDFETIARIDNHRPQSAIASYSFADKKATTSSKVFYRLELVDPRGAVRFSRIVHIKPEGNGSFAIIPNPAQKFVQLSIGTGIKEAVNVAIYTVSGGIVYRHKHVLAIGQNNVRIDEVVNWAPGTYLVHVGAGTINEWRKLIISR